jgi:hypothetical protein
MSMKPGIGLPSRKAAPKTENRTQVEAERLDPAIFGFPKKKSPEQELLDNAEPLDFRRKPEPPPPAIPPAIKAEVTESPVENKKEKKEYIDKVVSAKLIDRLVEEYGFETAETHEALLPVPNSNKTLRVNFRSLTWDDYSWALSAISRKEKEEEALGNLWSDSQRAQAYQALTVCRCVVRIADIWTWDLFDMQEEIKAVSSRWQGDTHIGIPEFFSNTMAQRVFELFRKKMHPDLLFLLDEAVRTASNKEENEEEEVTDENPTEAT